jgi:hypothetical protein
VVAAQQMALVIVVTQDLTAFLMLLLQLLHQLVVEEVGIIQEFQD